MPQQPQQQPQQQQQQAPQQQAQQEAQQQSTAAEAAGEEVNMEALAAEWSTRRRASPFVPASRVLQARMSLSGDELSSQAAASMNMQLDSRLLEEGGALAMGAAAGAAAAMAAEQQQPRQYGKSVSMRGSLHRVLKAAVAAVGGSPRLSKPLVDVFARRSADGRRRQSAAGSDYVMPPVPMHPADKVLSMQVRVAAYT
jgi:hypothetical protein